MPTPRPGTRPTVPGPAWGAPKGRAPQAGRETEPLWPGQPPKCRACLAARHGGVAAPQRRLWGAGGARAAVGHKNPTRADGPRCPHAAGAPTSRNNPFPTNSAPDAGGRRGTAVRGEAAETARRAVPGQADPPEFLMWP